METSLSVKSILSEAWSILKREKKFLLLLGLVFVLGNFFLGGVKDWFTDQGWLMAQFIWGVITRIVELYVSLITIIVALKAVRNEPLVVRDIVVVNTSLLWTYVLISVYCGLIVSVGILLLIVPGIIWGITYSLATYLVVDQRLGVRDAMSESKRLTSGHRGRLFLIGISLLGINILGLLCLGVGVIVTIPVSLVAGGLVYERLTHQSIQPIQKQQQVELPVQEKPKADSDMSQYQI